MARRTLRLTKSSFPFQFPPNLNIDSGIAEGLEAFIGTVRLAHDAAVEKLNTINANPDLTTTGKKNATLELAASLLPQVDNLRKEAIKWRDSAQQEEERIKKGDPVRQFLNKEDKTVLELRAREIREAFRALDPVQRIPLFKKAVVSGDLEVVDALLNVPGPFQLIDEKVIEEDRDSRLDAIDPAGAAKVRDLRRAHQLAIGAVRTLVTKLKEQGLVERDTVEKLKEELVA